MKLIVLTPDTTLENEVQIINELFENGLERLHLRKPSFTTQQYRDYLRCIDISYYKYIVLHGCFELFDEFELGGIHLNSAARSDSSMWGRIKHISLLQISTSFHSWQEVQDNEFRYGYVFISPVFDSISKAGYEAGIELAGAGDLKRTLKAANKYCPSVFGLGGVGVEQLKTLDEHVFDGAAMLGAIWQSADPAGKFREALTVVRSL